MKAAFMNLDRNNFFYNYFLENKILKQSGGLPAEELVERIMFLARFAWRNHPGYYADGRIENLLFNFGLKLDEYADAATAEKKRKSLLPDLKSISILHLATELYQVGGHTRILYQFIKRHAVENQVIVLTSQCKKKLPQWFVDGIGEIPVIILDELDSVFERAAVLRQIADLSQKIMLYQHPWDAVPVIALSCKDAPPVLLENHAHSWFWLGASIADMVIAHTSFHTLFTQIMRPVKNSWYLPFTQLDDLQAITTPADKLQARERLGIPADCICLITLGTAEKFIPNADYNFYATAHKIVERFDRVQLYVIGSAYDDRYPVNRDKIHFLGYLADPDDYYRAADICLDALPQPSLGATLYATLIGMACPMYKYGSGLVFNSRNFSDTKLYDQHVGSVQNEEEYLEKLGFLIEHPEIRQQIAAEIRHDYVTLYSREQVAQNLARMFDAAERLEHAPAMIPDAQFRCDTESAEIADAGCLQDVYGSLLYFDGCFSLKDKALVLARLLVNPLYGIEVLELAGRLLLRKAKALFFIPEVSRRAYGSHYRVLSASVSSDSGK